MMTWPTDKIHISDIAKLGIDYIPEEGLPPWAVLAWSDHGLYVIGRSVDVTTCYKIVDMMEEKFNYNWDVEISDCADIVGWLESPGEYK